MKEDLEGEIWKPVVGYEDLYQISNYGVVKSLPKEWVTGVSTRRKHNGKLLSSSKSGNGYLVVNLSKDGKGKNFTIHQLVSMAFLNHKPDGMATVVDHIDGNKINNRVNNLQVISNRENTSKDKVGSSKFTGVYWYEKASKWRSCIQINGRNIHLGYFIDEEEANQMYQVALSNIDKYDGDAKAFREFILN